MPMPKPCERCGIRIEERGRYQDYCEECQEILKKEGHHKYYKRGKKK